MGEKNVHLFVELHDDSIRIDDYFCSIRLNFVSLTYVKHFIQRGV